jgi:hypothetical protein
MKFRVPHPLWILMAAVMLVVGAVGVQFGLPIYRHHRAIRKLLLRHADVVTTNGGPDWLRSWLGDEQMRIFDRVSGVHTRGTDFNDLDAQHLTKLREMKVLVLSMTEVTDDGMANMTGLVNLEVLELDGTEITDDGLRHLRRLKNLDLLSLDWTRVTDSGLQYLGRLPRLRRLDLGNTQVTDKGLEHLKGLSRLRELYVKNTEVTDAGVAELQRALPDLKIER